MKTTYGTSIFRISNIIFMVFIVFVTLFPFLNIVAKSFSDMRNLAMNTVTFYPKGFNVDTYKMVLGDTMFWINYRNTIFYTVAGTALSMIMTILLAYPLSLTHLRGKKLIGTFVICTMFFNGGMIPNYVLVRALGMRNTIWAILIPTAISTYNVIIMRTFFAAIPNELREAAVIDGMDTYGILFRIILPLSKPILATVSLFYAVGMWNNWFSAFLYLDHAELYPVIIYLRNIVMGSTMVEGGAAANELGQVAGNIKAVTIVLTSIPILSVYPFLQKYFAKGVMIGAVKG